MALPDEADNAGAGQQVIKKPVWSDEEDRVLRDQVRLHGAQNWGTISLALPGRSCKSCRRRWTKHLDPDVEAARSFRPEEDGVIIRYQRVYGNRWSTIARFLPGRTDNAIKNRWNSVLRKRYARGGKQTPPRVCLPLFPLASGDVRWNGRGDGPGCPQVLPLAPREDVAGDERGAAMECLELMPLAPGDVRNNASAAASMDVDCGARDPLTVLRLVPAAAAVFDAVPCPGVDSCLAFRCSFFYIVVDLKEFPSEIELVIEELWMMRL